MKEGKNVSKKITRKKVNKVLLSESMSKKQKYLILGLSSILIGFTIYIGISFVLKNIFIVEPAYEEIDLKEYQKLAKGSAKVVVYIADETDELHKNYETIVASVSNSRKTTIKFLNLNELIKSDNLIPFMETIELTKETYTDPMIIIFEDGKVKDSVLGSVSRSELNKFLDKNRID
jgi:hypothetical protein